MSKICQHCGQGFTPKAAVRIEQKYCSDRCRHRAWQQRQQPSTSMNDLTEQAQILSQPGPQNWQEYVIRDLQEKVREYRENNRDLKSRLEQTQKELFAAEKDLAFKDREYELQMREREQNRKGGLEGIVETAYEHPEATSTLINSLAGLLGAARGPQGVAGIPATQEEADPNIENFKAWYLALDDRQKQAFGYVLQAFADSEDYLRAAQIIVNALKHDSTTQKAV
ncbi:hypothetical protein AAG747_14055 [Rapidithrix thailandica]|uniref:Uncharacterized protein n=1 Tax=Rapidithrix thailandica TaxID=413964 RepID=A0AAW9S9D1_9BACT